MRYCALLLAVLLFFAPTAADAQNTQDLEVGFKAGGALSTFHGNTGAITRGGSLDYQRREGFHAGAFVSIPLNAVLSVRPGLTYVQKGASVDDTRAFGVDSSPPIDVQESYEFSYLQLPLLLEARLPTGRSFQSYLVLGPSVGVNVQKNIERNEDVQTEAIPESEVNPLEVGFIGGFEFGYEVRDLGTVTLGANYDLGLNQIIPDDEAAAEKGKEAEFRNGALTLSLGYRFSL
jgi:hypothetical protein